VSDVEPGSAVSVVDAGGRLSVYPNITNLEGSGYWLMPPIVEKHRANVVFVNIKHRFISFGRIY